MRGECAGGNCASFQKPCGDHRERHQDRIVLLPRILHEVVDVHLHPKANETPNESEQDEVAARTAGGGGGGDDGKAGRDPCAVRRHLPRGREGSDWGAPEEYVGEVEAVEEVLDEVVVFAGNDTVRHADPSGVKVGFSTSSASTMNRDLPQRHDE